MFLLMSKKIVNKKKMRYMGGKSLSEEQSSDESWRNTDEIQFLALHICKGQHIPKQPFKALKKQPKTIPPTGVLIVPRL